MIVVEFCQKLCKVVQEFRSEHSNAVASLEFASKKTNCWICR